MRRIIRDLATEPRPSSTRALELPEDLQVAGIEARRLRVEHWRVIYVIDQDLDLITILAVRRRPPYTYDDLQDLLG